MPASCNHVAWGTFKLGTKDYCDMSPVQQALTGASLPLTQGTRRTVVKSVAADLALGSLLDADSANPSTVPSADPSAAPVLKTARARGNADETMAEPVATAALSAARIARIRPQQGAAQVFSGAHCR